MERKTMGEVKTFFVKKTNCVLIVWSWGVSGHLFCSGWGWFYWGSKGGWCGSICMNDVAASVGFAGWAFVAMCDHA